MQTRLLSSRKKYKQWKTKNVIQKHETHKQRKERELMEKLKLENDGPTGPLSLQDAINSRIAESGEDVDPIQTLERKEIVDSGNHWEDQQALKKQLRMQNEARKHQIEEQMEQNRIEAEQKLLEIKRMQENAGKEFDPLTMEVAGGADTATFYRQHGIKVGPDGKPIFLEGEDALDGIFEGIKDDKNTKVENEVFVWRLPGSDPPVIPSVAERGRARTLFQSGVDYLGPGSRTAHVAEKNVNSAEICFIGRSNVGKSTLINKLCGTATARVSRKPGKTIMLQMYAVGVNEHWFARKSLPNFRAMMVDLPGYGFAKVGRGMTKGLTDIIHDYLVRRDRAFLACVYLLIDARLGFTDHDQNMIDFLDSIKLPYQVVLTKCDLLKRDQLDKAAYEVGLELANPAHVGCHPIIFGVGGKGLGYTSIQEGTQLLRADILKKCDNHIEHRLRSRKRGG